MSLLAALGIAVAGVWAGMINAIVGSGTLVTFPTLLLFGYAPLTANVSNNIGLVAGGMAASWGYRHELDRGSGRVLRRLLPMSVLGAVVGAGLLLVLPESAFRGIVPVLVLLAIVLVVIGPTVQARAQPVPDGPVPGWHQQLLLVGVLGAGMYGGYFGAAQGVLLIGLLSALVQAPLQRINAYKNILALVVNVVAAASFLLFARDHVDWPVVVLIAVGSLVGGFVGARVGRRIPAPALRALIVVIGLVAIVKLIWFP